MSCADARCWNGSSTAARQAGSDEVVVVVSPQIEAGRRARLPDLALAVQSPPLGTGHAVEVGLAALAGAPEAVVVLSGDTPAIDPSTVERDDRGARRRGRRRGARDDARPAAPRLRARRARRRRRGEDRRGARRLPAELALDECNAGLYCFRAAALEDALARVGPRTTRASAT